MLRTWEGLRSVMATFLVRSMTKDDCQWMWDRAIELGWEISYVNMIDLKFSFFFSEVSFCCLADGGCLKEVFGVENKSSSSSSNRPPEITAAIKIITNAFCHYVYQKY